jgi:hypothetical protein
MFPESRPAKGNSMPEQPVEQELTWQQQRILNNMVSDNERKLWKAYVLWIIFGGFGMHRFYLGRNWTGFLMLALTITAFVCGQEVSTFHNDALQYLALPAWCAIVLWLIVDLFLIPSMARKFNARLPEELAKKVKAEWTV